MKRSGRTARGKGPAGGRAGLVEAAQLRRGDQITDENGNTLAVAGVQVHEDGFARIRWEDVVHGASRVPASHLVPVRNVRDDRAA